MEKLEIKNKVKDRLIDFDIFTKLMRCDDYSVLCKMGYVTIQIDSGVSKSDKRLKVNIKWCNSEITEKTAEFEYSESGFEQACEWLDEKRLEFIKELL